MTDNPTAQSQALSQHNAIETTSLCIGVVDSGVGGLSVLDQLVCDFPNAHFVYLGDTANMPYGDKTPDELTQIVADYTQWFTNEVKPDVLVVACNSSGKYIPEKLSFPSLDPIESVLNHITESSMYQGVTRLGVIATPATVASNRYQDLATAKKIPMSLEVLACPGLASAVEHADEASAIRVCLEPSLRLWLENPPSHVVLGCTHYPFALPVLQELLPSVAWIDPAMVMSSRLKQLIANHHVRGMNKMSSTETSRLTLYVSGEPDAFDATARQLPLQNVLSLLTKPNKMTVSYAITDV